jgi:hypothetical protein
VQQIETTTVKATTMRRRDDEDNDELDKLRYEFFVQMLNDLNSSHTAFLLGGAYAVECYTTVHRATKDLDLFVQYEDCATLLQHLQKCGYQTEMTHHWLAKAKKGRFFADLIFNSANGICFVDKAWFSNSIEHEAFGIPVRLVPVEEMIWQKAYIMEKERYDGADVNHLIKCHGSSLDWKRLVDRFGSHWRVLYSHIVMFRFVYPKDQSSIPKWVIEEFTRRELQEWESDNCQHDDTSELTCYGTLLSRAQYLTDISKWNYSDPRKEFLNDAEIREWTMKIPRLEIYDQNFVQQKSTIHALNGYQQNNHSTNN